MWGICAIVAVVLLVLGLCIFWMYRPSRQSSDRDEIDRCDHKQVETTYDEVDESEYPEEENMDKVQLLGGSSSHKDKRAKYMRSMTQQPIIEAGRTHGRKLHRFGEQNVRDLVNMDNLQKREMRTYRKLKNAMDCLEKAGLSLSNGIDSRLDIGEL